MVPNLEKYKKQKSLQENEQLDSAPDSKIENAEMSDVLKAHARFFREAAIQAGIRNAKEAAGMKINNLEELEGISSQKEFSKVWDFEENRELFEKWKEVYLEGKNESGVLYRDKMSIEAFVLDRQMEKIEGVRKELKNKRIKGYLKELYPEIDQSDEEPKLNDLNKSTDDFFTKNNDLIEKWEIDRSKTLSLKLETKFKNKVFPDISTNSPEYKFVQKLFKELLSDYLDMQLEKRKLYLLNNTMVEMMTGPEINEAQWLEGLAKASEKESEKQKEKEKAKEEEKEFFSTPLSIDKISFGDSYYADSINAGEEMASNTKIIFRYKGKGAYRIIFPLTANGRPMESTFFAKDENNFLFNDKLMEKSYKVGLVEGVNRSYLENIMSTAIRVDEEYTGPNLNEGILPDNEMFKLAQNLFSPLDIKKKPIDKRHADAFQRLLEVIVSKNNSNGTGYYGDILSVNRRVKLMQTKLEPLGRGMTFMNHLMGKTKEEMENLNVELLCKELKIPKTTQ